MFDKAKVEAATRLLLEGIGEDVTREGLIETPKRVAKFYEQVLNGVDLNPMDHMKIFHEKTRNMVVVKDIPFYSFCEHHIAPFFGKIAIAYIPDGKVLGLSKLARIARTFSKNLQIQERLTDQIAEFLNNNLECKGVAVKIEAEHMCMAMRGVRTPGAKTVTTRLIGVFLDKPEVREEFYNALR